MKYISQITKYFYFELVYKNKKLVSNNKSYTSSIFTSPALFPRVGIPSILLLRSVGDTMLKGITRYVPLFFTTLII